MCFNNFRGYTNTTELNCMIYIISCGKISDIKAQVISNCKVKSLPFLTSH